MKALDTLAKRTPGALVLMRKTRARQRQGTSALWWVFLSGCAQYFLMRRPPQSHVVWWGEVVYVLITSTWGGPCDFVLLGPKHTERSRRTRALMLLGSKAEWVDGQMCAQNRGRSTTLHKTKQHLGPRLGPFLFLLYHILIPLSSLCFTFDYSVDPAPSQHFPVSIDDFPLPLLLLLILP